MTQHPDLLPEHERAAHWYVRRGGADWTHADEQAFQAWRSADPRHEQIYRQLEQTWLDLGQVPRPRLAGGAQVAVPSQRGRAASASRAVLWRHLRYQWKVMALAACLLLMAGGWFAYDNVPSYRLDVATGHEPRTLALPDGSRIALNMDSAVQIRLYARRREVNLQRGEAFFEVNHNPDRPFTVLSGESEVRVVGTVFDVRTDARQLVVQVREGRVEVRPDARIRERFTILTANEALQVDDPSEQGRRFVVSSDMVGDWSSGQLVFRGTSLASVIDTLARYMDKPVRLDAPSLGGLAVSGYVATSSPGIFVESLPDLLPVKVRREADGAYRISYR